MPEKCRLLIQINRGFHIPIRKSFLESREQSRQRQQETRRRRAASNESDDEYSSGQSNRNDGSRRGFTFCFFPDRLYFSSYFFSFLGVEDRHNRDFWVCLLYFLFDL